MTETLDLPTIACMTMTADKGSLHKEAAVRFARRQGLEILYYDRTLGLVHLSDGEAYSWKAIYTDNGDSFRASRKGLMDDPTAVWCNRCDDYHPTANGMTLYQHAFRHEGSVRHFVGQCGGEA